MLLDRGEDTKDPHPVIRAMSDAKICTKMMKKILYFILLAAELFVDVLFMMGLANSSLYIPIVIAIVATLAALIWLIILFAKAEDKKTRIKIMLGIALSMLIPLIVFAITFVVVAVLFVIAFSN